jgi:xanthine dehydrogenase accessory factor
MTSTVEHLRAFCAAEGRVALVEVSATKGSTPRETGAFMLVSPAAIWGTIGGGQLEFIAIAKARLMLAKRSLQRDGKLDQDLIVLDVPLGPEIGQCCGGRVEVVIRPIDPALQDELIARAQADAARLPSAGVAAGAYRRGGNPGRGAGRHACRSGDKADADA